MYDLFIGSDFQDSKNVDAWSAGVEYDDLVETIERVLGAKDLNEGEEIVIIVRPEFEGG